jgi:hypothetical protein
MVTVEYYVSLILCSDVVALNQYIATSSVLSCFIFSNKYFGVNLTAVRLLLY